MTHAVIQRLRRLEGRAIIKPAQCIRAERYVERHLEIFSDAANMTVSQAADLALESATSTILGSRPAQKRGSLSFSSRFTCSAGYAASIEIINSINLIDCSELATMLTALLGLGGSSLSSTNGIDLPLTERNSKS